MNLNAIIVLPVMILMMLFPCGLLCILEYFLAQMDSPWPGLVLPVLSGMTSSSIFLLIVFNISAVTGAGGARVLLIALLLLLIMSIPTVLFLVVYRVTRRHQIEKKNMDKMNIQDLE